MLKSAAIIIITTLFLVSCGTPTVVLRDNDKDVFITKNVVTHNKKAPVRAKAEPEPTEKEDGKMVEVTDKNYRHDHGKGDHTAGKGKGHDKGKGHK